MASSVTLRTITYRGAEGIQEWSDRRQCTHGAHDGRMDSLRYISHVVTLWWLLFRPVVACPAAVWNYIREWLLFWRQANRFPSPPGLPLLGHVWQFATAPTGLQLMDWVTDQYRKFHNFLVTVGPLKFFLIGNPRDIQVVFTNSQNRDKPFIYEYFHEFFRGLGALQGDTWKRHVNIIAPVFRSDAVCSYMRVFNDAADVLVESLRPHAGGDPFDFLPFAKDVAVNIIFDTMLGASTKASSEDKLEFTAALHDILKLLGERIRRPWLHPSQLYEMSSLKKRGTEARRRLYRVIDEAMERYSQQLQEEGEKDSQSWSDTKGKMMGTGLMDHLLRQRKYGAPISEDEIEQEMGIFLFAGFDTSFMFLQSSLYIISKHPLVQEKVVQELEREFGACDNPDFSADCLNRLPYLDMVFKETLRMFPPVWIIGRKANVETPLASNDLTLPAGATAFVSIKALHMDPELYSEPQAFNPERFSKDNAAERHPNAFLAFGAGSRVCIGRKFAEMEWKTVFSKVLWNYEVLPDPSYEPKIDWNLVIHIKNGMWISLKKRNHSKSEVPC